MPRAKPAFTDRRVLSKQQSAFYIGKSTSWLDEHAEELYAQGFPRPLGTLGGYDKAAIDRWVDRLGGNTEPDAKDHDRAWREASSGG